MMNSSQKLSVASKEKSMEENSNGKQQYSVPKYERNIPNDSGLQSRAYVAASPPMRPVTFSEQKHSQYYNDKQLEDLIVDIRQYEQDQNIQQQQKKQEMYQT